MNRKAVILTFGLCVLMLMGSPAARAQVRLNVGIGYPARPYYAPRYYYPPRRAVYVAPPRPVIVAPAPYYCAPRPVYYAPRPIYRGRGYYGGRGRR